MYSHIIQINSNYAQSELDPVEQAGSPNELHPRIACQIAAMNQEWLNYQECTPWERVQRGVSFLRDQRVDWPVVELLETADEAQEQGHDEIGAALIQFGLFRSIHRGDLEAVELFLQSTALDGNCIQEALQFAREKGQSDIIMLLRSRVCPSIPEEITAKIARYCNDDKTIMAMGNSSHQIRSALLSWGDKPDQENLLLNARERRLRQAALTLSRRMKSDSLHFTS